MTEDEEVYLDRLVCAIEHIAGALNRLADAAEVAQAATEERWTPTNYREE